MYLHINPSPSYNLLLFSVSFRSSECAPFIVVYTNLRRDAIKQKTRKKSGFMNVFRA